VDLERCEAARSLRALGSAGLLLVALVGTGCPVAEETASESGEHVHWGYSGAHGPEHWGELWEDFAACSEGRSQSPIDVIDPVDVDLPPIELAYHGSTVAVQNNGHTLQFDVGPGSSLAVGGETFELAQFHVHSPSEHRIEGELFSLEIHFVHSNDRGELLVLAVLFREGGVEPRSREAGNQRTHEDRGIHSLRRSNRRARDRARREGVLSL
jgi:carbonic anhydrase